MRLGFGPVYPEGPKKTIKPGNSERIRSSDRKLHCSTTSVFRSTPILVWIIPELSLPQCYIIYPPAQRVASTPMGYFTMKNTALIQRTLLFSLAVVVSPVPALAAVENDFSAYPPEAQSCLYLAAGVSGCDGDTVPEMNSCLCGDLKGGWVTATAECLGSTGVSSSVVEGTFSQMQTNCQDSNTPLGLDWELFFTIFSISSSKQTSTTQVTTSARTTMMESKTATASHEEDEEKTVVFTFPGGEGTTLTTHVAPTATDPLTVVLTVSGRPTTLTTQIVAAADATTTPMDDSGDGGGGLSNGARIGVIAGCTSAGVLAIAAAVYFIMRRRKNAARRKMHAEAQSMLYPMAQPHHGQHHSTAPPHATTSTLFSPFSPSQLSNFKTPTTYGGAEVAGAVSPGVDAKWTPESQVFGMPHQTQQWKQQQQQQQPQFPAELPDTQEPRYFELDSGGRRQQQQQQ